jgi:bacterial/archaeal transporter family protein
LNVQLEIGRHVMGWQIFAIISAVAAGATSVFAKAGLDVVPAHLGNAVRTAVILGLCLAVLWWSGEYSKTSTLTRKAWLLLALSGLTTAVSWVAFFKALSLGAATSVTAIDKASLVVTLVLSLLFLSERLTWKIGFGALLIVSGAILVSASTANR